MRQFKRLFGIVFTRLATGDDARFTHLAIADV